MSVVTQDVKANWKTIEPLLSIRDERDYDLAVERLSELLDEVGTDERHPLYGLLDTLGTLVHAYEEKHHPVPGCSGADALRYLMEEHGLSEGELPEVGSSAGVDDVLSGRRELSLEQVRALAERFHVSPAVFI